LLLGKKNTVEAKACLDKHYTDSAPAKSTVEKWFANLNEAKEAVTDENIKKIHKIILNNRKVNLIEIAETLKISKERVGHIVHEYLDM
jgi:hypothetical protein